MHSDPDICGQVLTKAFDSHEKKRYHHMELDLLKSLPPYQSWLSSTSSSLLLLAGEIEINARAGRGYTHFWLSPAPLIVVDILREDGERGAYYSAHPGVRIDEHDLDTVLAKDMLVKLSYTLLKLEPKSCDATSRSYVQSPNLPISVFWTQCPLRIKI